MELINMNPTSTADDRLYVCYSWCEAICLGFCTLYCEGIYSMIVGLDTGAGPNQSLSYVCGG